MLIAWVLRDKLCYTRSRLSGEKKKECMYKICLEYYTDDEWMFVVSTHTAYSINKMLG